MGQGRIPNFVFYFEHCLAKRVGLQFFTCTRGVKTARCLGNWEYAGIHICKEDAMRMPHASPPWKTAWRELCRCFCCRTGGSCTRGHLQVQLPSQHLAWAQSRSCSTRHRSQFREGQQRFLPWGRVLKHHGITLWDNPALQWLPAGRWCCRGKQNDLTDHFTAELW